MFHVELFMKIFLLLIITICISGCNKPNPHPETLDPIYADLQKRAADAKKAAEDEKKTIQEHEKEMKEAKPQTGQIKYAEKRFYESKLRHEKLLQLASYFEMRAESRIQYARTEYMKAWNKKEPWPNPSEYKEYLSTTEAQFKKKAWNANDRITKYLEENPNLVHKVKKPESGGHGESKSEEKGGH